jgi:cephalosporin hydroxylase
MDIFKEDEALSAAWKIGMMQVRSEITLAASFMKLWKPKIIVEIGAAYGGTMSLWVKICSPTLAVSIDSETNRYGDPAIDHAARKKMLNDLGVVCVSGDSHDLKTIDALNNVLGEKRIDALIIDGDHTFEGAGQDYLLYSRLLSPDGFVLMHDIKKSKFHDSVNCRVGSFFESLGGKLKISLLGEGESGGWGIVFP